LAFAELLQEPFSPFWRLQNFCKDAFPHFGLCRTSAKALFPVLAFAELLQERFSPFWRLQNFCKRRFLHFGVCRTPAKTKKFFVAFAAFLQRPKSFSGHLQHFCKHQNFIFRFARLLQRLTSPSAPRISRKKEAEISLLPNDFTLPIHTHINHQ